MRSLRSIAVALAVAQMTSSTAFADEPACADPDDAEAIARIAEAQAGLDDDALWSKVWWYGWLAGYTALAIGQLTLGLIDDSTKDRDTYLVGMTGSVIAAALLGIRPMTSAYGADWLRATAGDTPEQRQEKLRVAEDLLETAHDRQESARGWLAHTGAGVWTLGASAFVYWVIDDDIGALKTLIGSAVLGLGRVFTAPSGSIDAWRAYTASHPTRACSETARRRAPAAPAGPTWAVYPTGLGLGAAVRF